MKNVWKAVVIMIALAASASAQNVNWRSVGEDQPNIVRVITGYDYGAAIQAGYYRFVDLGRPVLLGLDYTQPMGSDLLDDFKVRLGGEVEVVEYDGFSATVRILSNFRRYETDYVRIVSFGSELAGVVGYYNTSWYAAGELGFDKAIATHMKHSEILRSYFPGITDGWYLPTGGNWFYGIQAGKTIGNSLELNLRAGATNAQFQDENAMLPYYVQLGVGVKF